MEGADEHSNRTIMTEKRKIVYCTPSLYMAGGLERVLTTKANFFADVLNYDVYIVITDGKGKTPYYQLSSKIHLVQFDINFEQLWNRNFIFKTILYIQKQIIFKYKLTRLLNNITPDFTISLLRREINFITKIKDGSIKIGELHVNRNNYRNFEEGNSNIFKRIFSRIWMKDLSKKLKELDKLVVLTNEDKINWSELDNVVVINNPLDNKSEKVSSLNSKRVIAVGRYVYQKGFDLLLQSWAIVLKKHSDWHLYIYGYGEKDFYIDYAKKMGIIDNCHFNSAVNDINEEYVKSSVFAFSSRFEGFGMALIEAMSCGLPCVSFDCPCGPKDIIENGKNGFLVKSFNIEDYAEKLNILIENENIRKEIGNEALLSSGRYTIDEIGNTWKLLFDELYSKGK